MLWCALWNKRGCGVIWGVTLLWSDEVKPAVWFKCVWTELRVWFLHPVNCSKNRAHTWSVCRVRMIAYSCCLTDINKELKATRWKLCLVEEYCFGWASTQIVCTDECRSRHRCTPYITEDTIVLVLSINSVMFNSSENKTSCLHFASQVRCVYWQTSP